MTGVNSFLGTSTARYFLKQGFTVIGILRPLSKAPDCLRDFLRFIPYNLLLDVNSEKSAEHISIFYDYVEDMADYYDLDITFIHFGWGGTLDRNNNIVQKKNIEYGLLVFEMAKVLKAKRFIFAGSQAEYGETQYGIYKNMFANTVMQLAYDDKVKFIHMRIFSVYGAGDRETSLLKTFVKSIKENKDFDLSSCDYLWNFLYIDDFVKIIDGMIANDTATGVYDIASFDTRLLKDYIMEAYEVLGGKNRLNFGARPDSEEKFATPDLTNLIDAIPNLQFTPFSVGIKSLL